MYIILAFTGAKRNGSSTPSADQSSSSTLAVKGKNTFAVPRNVRPLGFSANKPKAVEGEDEIPKSNDEFRNMLLKKSS